MESECTTTQVKNRNISENTTIQDSIVFTNHRLSIASDHFARFAEPVKIKLYHHQFV